MLITHCPCISCLQIVSSFPSASICNTLSPSTSSTNVSQHEVKTLSSQLHYQHRVFPCAFLAWHGPKLIYKTCTKLGSVPNLISSFNHLSLFDFFTGRRWQARIGIPGQKEMNLGRFDTDREAAIMYDQALVRLKGSAAATNFALSNYSAALADHQRMQQVGHATLLAIFSAHFSCVTLA